MRDQTDTQSDRTRTLLWISATTVCVLTAILLVTGLVVPGFLLDSSESSATTGESDGAPATVPREPPWAQAHLDLGLTPDAAMSVTARRFVGRLNTHRAADAVDMLCADKRRVLRGSVVWTASHRARLRITMPLRHVARPGYVTIRFAGHIDGRPRRGTFGIDADANGRPRCVSAFYSVG